MSENLPVNNPAAEVFDKDASLPATALTGGGLNPEIPTHAAALERLQQLEEALLNRDPMMKQHLLEIHKQLIGYEELVHLLSDEQIGIIMAAQQLHTNTVLTSSAATPTGKKRVSAAAAKLTINDL